ncbi:MAG: primosomal protein N' [Candidatus Rokubacteria bacterium]|nr:primosomal protein N' [Candidatus Rokubacteria bacterium]
MLIVDVVFDAPIPHPFSYLVPEGCVVRAGQRVRAPLRGAPRVGLVTAIRETTEARSLKPIAGVVDPNPVASAAQLDLLRWISAQSLSSLGSSAAALLPPPLPSSAATTADAASETTPAGKPELHLGAGRERRLLAIAERAPLLVLVADGDASARWAQRLGRIDRVARLDSTVGDADRARGWADLEAGRVRLAVGTRSAWLAPLPSDGAIAVVEEAEAAHKPPGHPRIHARDVALERAAREARRLVLSAGAPSVEMWWRATSGYAELVPGDAAPWPAVSIADTRGILRREPLTPELARMLRDTLGAGGRTFLAVSRLASALACDECGMVVRCPACAVAFSYTRAAALLACRLCATTAALPETCPECHGRRLSPFGWGIERVEHAVRRRFPKARVARYDPDARGKKKPAQRAEAIDADVVIGTRGALRLFGRGSLALAGFVAPDQLLRQPDFRAGERMLGFVWAAAERIRAGGHLIIQSQNPAHHAFEAVAAHDLGRFYAPELRFRAELRYPPFRRLAIVTVPSGASPTPDDVAGALAGPDIVVYPPTPARNGKTHRIVVKSGDALPEAIRAALQALSPETAARRGIIDVEVDPVEWLS